MTCDELLNKLLAYLEAQGATVWSEEDNGDEAISSVEIGGQDFDIEVRIR